MKFSVVPSACAVTLLFASASFAQTTPEAFLDEIIDLYEKQGMTMVIGEQSREGDTLAVRDVRFQMSSQGAEVDMRFDGFDISEIDNPDYDLEVSHADTLDFDVESKVEGVEVVYGLSIDSSGRYLIGGDAENRTLFVDYPSVNVKVNEFSINGEEMPPVDISITANGSNGLIKVTGGSHVEYDMTIADVGVAVSYSDDTVKVDFAYLAEALAMTGNGPVINMVDSEILLASTIPMIISMTSESTKIDLVGSGEENFEFTSTGGGSFFKGTIGNGVLDYDFGGSNIVASLAADAMPIPPVEVGFSDIRTRVAMPLIPSDDARPAAYLLSFDGVTISEGLWSLVDPGQAIPRDPMTILLDLTGSARALYSLFDQDEILAHMGDVPFEIQDLQVNAIRLSAGGAEVTGTGDAVFNNDGPFPMPVGAVDFKITGINGLIEKLVGAGILQAEQAMPVQMVLGMFAKPGSSPDEFTSRVEMTEQGSITANGIPLQ